MEKSLSSRIRREIQLLSSAKYFYFWYFILNNIVSEKNGVRRKACLVLSEENCSHPVLKKNVSISAVKCFQHRLPSIRKFQHELTVKIIVLIVIKSNLPMALDVLFCKDSMENAENSFERNFTLFPKHVTFTPRYGQLVLGNTLSEIDIPLFQRHTLFNLRRLSSPKNVLKVGSCRFEGIIILLIHFLNCQKALFTKK